MPTDVLGKDTTLSLWDTIAQTLSSCTPWQAFANGAWQDERHRYRFLETGVMRLDHELGTLTPPAYGVAPIHLPSVTETGQCFGP